ncbi:TerC family protein [Propioniciclava coleopterorum]|uniref:TerC family protein n=1 Tax=Propioniciclava coleopterorum TaxID=2714937 RepID=A0A6G7Y3W0_9ACTN|nr:TerC family protein [Propioniciclava coleopterorum]QIK71574.1 TerC family protein [Propioniciclava coleopterorum]
MGVSPTQWIITAVVILGLLAFDFFFHVRKAHIPTIKESATWTSIYVSIAIMFGVFVWLTMGQKSGIEYYAGYITELSLSVDNLFVFLIIMASFKVPRADQQKVLMFGIVVSLIFRTGFIFLGAVLINSFAWVFYIFGVILLITAGNLLKPEKDEDDEDSSEANNFIIKLAKRFMHTTDYYDGDKLFTMENGRKAMTPMLLVMIAIGGTDVMFALDSIPAIFGLTQNTYIVFTAVAFSLLGLRQLYFLIDGLLDRLIYLKYGLAVILGFIGVKLILHALHENNVPFINGGQPVSVVEVTTELSLAVILVTLLVVIVMSLMSPKGRALTTIKNTRRHAKQYLDTGFEADPVIRDKNYRALIAEEQTLLGLPEKHRELIHDEDELLDLLDEAHATHERYVAENPERFTDGDPMSGKPRIDTDAYRRAMENPDAFEGHDHED